jgi:hypothetical protein
MTASSLSIYSHRAYEASQVIPTPTLELKASRVEKLTRIISLLTGAILNVPLIVVVVVMSCK